MPDDGDDVQFVDKKEYVFGYIARTHEQDKEEIEQQTLRDLDYAEKRNCRDNEAVKLKQSRSGSIVGQVDQLADLVTRLQAPDIELDVFTGDPLQFHFFMTTFAEVVETKIHDERGRLTRLLKYLSGEPKDLVSGCIYLSSHDFYKKLRKCW